MTSALPPTNTTEHSVSSESPDTRLHMGSLVTGGIFVVVGTSWLLELFDIVDVRWSMLLPVTIVLVGIALMFGARRGRTGGLVVLGLILVAVALVTSTFARTDLHWSGPVGSQRETPVSLSQLDEEYSVGAGSLELDLTSIEPSEYDGVQRLRLDIGMGEMRVQVPDDVGVRLIADVGMGEVSLMGTEVSGVGVVRTLESDGYDDEEAQLEIRGRVGMGNLRIERD